MLILSRNYESLRILLYLGSKVRFQTTTSDIAVALSLPLAVCRKRVWQLCDAGLLTGARGYGGGVQLAARPEHIFIGDVVAAIEAQRRPAHDICTECKALLERAARRFYAELNLVRLSDIASKTDAINDEQARSPHSAVEVRRSNAGSTEPMTV